jgi:hemerythrin superfamily protein
MDPFELLKSDHDQVSRMFNQLEEAEDLDEKQRIILDLRQLLDAHSYLEETVFYPIFQDEEDFREIIDDFYDDHQEVKILLDEINEVSTEEELDEKIAELVDCVEGHVEDEENELFPKIEERANSDELLQIGNQLLEARKRLNLPEAA